MKVAVVTGCSSGLGKALVRTLHTGSWSVSGGCKLRVFATSRNLQAIEDLKLEGIDTVQLNVSDPESVKSAIHHIVQEAGGVDLLVWARDGIQQNLCQYQHVQNRRKVLDIAVEEGTIVLCSVPADRRGDTDKQWVCPVLHCRKALSRPDLTFSHLHKHQHLHGQKVALYTGYYVPNALDEYSGEAVIFKPSKNGSQLIGKPLESSSSPRSDNNIAHAATALQADAQPHPKAQTGPKARVQPEAQPTSGSSSIHTGSLQRYEPVSSLATPKEREPQSKQTQLPQLDRNYLPMACVADTAMHSQRMDAQEELQQLKEKLWRKDEELKESKAENRRQKDESVSMQLQMLQEKADLLKQQLTEAQQDRSEVREINRLQARMNTDITAAVKQTFKVVDPVHLLGSPRDM